MAKVDYDGIKDSIVTHLGNQIAADSTTALYQVTDQYSANNLGSHPVVIVVRFAGIKPDPENSITSSPRARTAVYNIMLNTNGLDDEAADALLNVAITDFEYYLGYNCQTGFVYGEQIIQKAGINGADKYKDPTTGMYVKMPLEVFILETG
jgi:hypothetical protein